MLLRITFLNEATRVLCPDNATLENLAHIVKDAVGETVGALLGLTGNFNGVLLKRNGDEYSLGLPFSSSTIQAAGATSPQDFKDHVQTFLERKLLESPDVDINAPYPIKVRLE